MFKSLSFSNNKRSGKGLARIADENMSTPAYARAAQLEAQPGRA